MQKNKIIFLFHILLLVVFSASAFAADTVKIAEGGKALATIEIAPDASVATRSVAIEMARYLRRIGGVPFQVAQQPGAGPRIVLGRSNEFPAYDQGNQLRGNGQEAFLMRTEGDKVLLLGVTDRAASHAAYAFLEELGVRWFFPMEEWEVVPESKTLTANFDEVQSPDLPRHRTIWYGGMHSGFEVNVIRQDWMRRNRMKPDGPAQSHSWVGLDPKKDFAEHPEWFALVDGKRRPSKPNYGHPEVVKKAVAIALNAAEKGADSVSVSAPDGLGFCECDQCLQVAGVARDTVFKQNGAIFGKRPDGTEVCVTSETIFRMANIVAEAVGQKHPDVLISIYAYSGYAHPPSFGLEPNIYVPVASAYRRTPLTFEEQIKTFGDKAEQLGIYDYYNITPWHGFKPNAGKKIAELQERMKFYHANSVQGVNAEGNNNWAPAGLDFYVASKLMWDVDADVDAIYADFLEKAFGAAKVPMKSYYDRWEAKVELAPASIGGALSGLIAAYRLADTQAAKTRIAQLYLYNRFVWLGQELKQTKENPQRAAEAAREYADLGWRLKDTNLLHDRRSRYVNRPLVPAFTAQEIETLMAQDTAWLKENQAMFLTRSRKLVPITTANRAVPGLQEQPIEAGGFGTLHLIVPAQAGETIEVGVKPRRAVSYYGITYMTTEQFQAKTNPNLAEKVTTGETADKVSFEAPKTGYYRVAFSNLAGVTSVSHPHAFDGIHDMLSATLYFYVPAGTKQFTLAASAYKDPTIMVRDAAGNTVFPNEDFKGAGEQNSLETTITVPEGADGAIWSMTESSNRRSGIRLTGVPEYFSFSPHQLLVAQEYLK